MRKILSVVPLLLLVLLIFTGLPARGENNPFSDARNIPAVRTAPTPAPEPLPQPTATRIFPRIKIRILPPGPSITPAATQVSQRGAVFDQENLNIRPVEIRIPEWLRKFLNIFGAKLPPGARIVIIKGNSNPTPVPPSQPPPPSSPGAVKKLIAQMKAKFGITARNGQGATWSQRQLEEANKVLATLPASFRRHTKTIQRDATFQNNSNILGYVQMGIPTVHLMNSSAKMGTFQGTLVHEMTHTFQAANPQVTKQWEKTFWPVWGILGPIPRSVSDYGNSKPLEDMAESVRVYWQNAAYMKKTQPKRYEFIKNNVMGGKEFNT